MYRLSAPGFADGRGDSAKHEDAADGLVPGCVTTTDKRGLSALLLQRRLALRRYETGCITLHKFRRAVVNVAREPLHGHSLDRLIEYGTEPIPDAISVVNPEWRKLDGQTRSKTRQRHRLTAQFGDLALSENPTQSELHGFQQRNGQLREEIHTLDLEIDNLKPRRKNTQVIWPACRPGGSRTVHDALPPASRLIF